MKVTKEMTNLQISELLRAVAASYKIKDLNKNKFKIIAYERAADSIEHATSELKDLWDDGKLDEVPSVGSSIAEHLDEIFRTGRSKHFEEVMKGLPPSMFELMEVPGIGAKTAFRFSHELGIKSLNDLEKAANKGKIAKLEGFGSDSQKSILQSLKEVKGRSRRQLLPYASQIASEVVEWLKMNKDVIRVDPLGSLRRKSATVGDIDLSVSTRSPGSVLEHFTNYPKKQRILEKGERTASIILPGDIQVDLMVEKPEAYGALLQHFTGSKNHNIALREYALKKNLSLSDYGIYILNKKSDALKKFAEKQKTLKKIATEEDFYKFLSMDYIEPELREDTGEIVAALNHSLPDLIKISDVKSDLQIHSSFDIETSHDLGESSMEEIIEKANSQNYEFVAFTEHNPSQSGHNDKQIIDILKSKSEKVSEINIELKNDNFSKIKKVFNSLEIDIKPEGGLPVPEEGMSTLDFALVSIHSSFKQDRKKMTARVLSALKHPKVKIFAHPTARKINEREGIELDWPQIFDFCIKNNKWVEINCDSMRLDLPDTLVREAVKHGVKMSFGTDAHHKDALDNMIWGVYVARRGWAEKKDIINTRSLEEFQKLIND